MVSWRSDDGLYFGVGREPVRSSEEGETVGFSFNKDAVVGKKKM